MTAVAFHSVKLPAALIEQARESAEVFRRSTAAQVEYWALLGKAVEESGITVKEARCAMTQAAPPSSLTPSMDELDAIEARFDAAIQSATLAARMREVVSANQAKATAQHRKAA
jgi:ParD-like antitoxin of type II bacterial toxin-antitoxin system